MHFVASEEPPLFVGLPGSDLQQGCVLLSNNDSAVREDPFLLSTLERVWGEVEGSLEQQKY